MRGRLRRIDPSARGVLSKEVAMNIARLAERNLEEFGPYDCLFYEDRPMTNQEFIVLASRFAAGLEGLGAQRGDRLAVLAANSPEVILSYSAIWRLGGIAIPVVLALAPGEIRYILENSGTKIVITSPELLPKLKDATSGSSPVEKIILMGNERHEGTTLMGEVISSGSERFATIEADEDDVCTIIYTAGTTGRPKGVMLTHGNLLSNADGFIRHVGLDHKDRRLVVLPLSHAFGLGTCNTTFLSGAKTYIMKSFNALEVLQAIERYRITQMSVVPTMIILMLNHPEAGRFDTSSMRLWISGSAPLPVEVMGAFERKFGGTILEGYGCSEASAGVSINPVKGPVKPGSVGVPFHEVEVKIVEVGGEGTPAGGEGEILVRGPNVMKGYYGMPEETREVLRDGWLHTGDICRVDEDGYIYVVDRIKDLIIRGGKNVYPKEVEEALYKLPQVAEAAVIGVPDAVYGEEVKAFVVLKPGQRATAEEIMEGCQGHIARYKAPKSVEIVEALPKSSLGKVLKRLLKERESPSLAPPRSAEK
jgi:long-chain acyl-CoA synthetase